MATLGLRGANVDAGKAVAALIGKASGTQQRALGAIIALILRGRSHLDFFKNILLPILASCCPGNARRYQCPRPHRNQKRSSRSCHRFRKNGFQNRDQRGHYGSAAERAAASASVPRRRRGYGRGDCISNRRRDRTASQDSAMHSMSPRRPGRPL